MKKIVFVFLTLMMGLVLFGCDEADRVSENLRKEADNFNTIRQLTVINAIQGDTLFQMTGKMSIHESTEPHQLEVIVETEEGKYKKHFVGLSDNVAYVVEDITNGTNVNKYQYTINFNPKMWIPSEIKTID